MNTVAIPRRVLRSEWIKLRSVRSTYLILILATIFGVGVGVLELSSVARHWASLSPTDKASFDPVADSFSGFEFGELAFGALGVLAIATEYATGMIRTTFVAVPRRGTVFAAKAVVLGAVALVVLEACAFASFFLGQAVLSSRHLGAGIGDLNVLRAVASAGLYMVVVTMVGFALGAIIRHTAGAMAAMFAIVFLSWPFARALEGFSYLPDRLLLVNAADALAATRPVTGAHSARIPSLGMAYLDLVIYLVVFLSVAAWRMTRDPR